MSSKGEETKKRIQKEAAKLFAEYGFNGTSTRMIASAAGINISAISLYFGGKQELYNACVTKNKELIKDFYDKAYSMIYEDLFNDLMTPKKAREYIEMMIDLQIEVAFRSKYRIVTATIYNENIQNRTEASGSLADTVFVKHERLMALLLTYLVPTTEKRAIICSRYINGSIIAFGEHRNIYQNHVDWSPEDDDFAPQWAIRMIRGLCIAALEKFVVEENTVGQ